MGALNKTSLIALKLVRDPINVGWSLRSGITSDAIVGILGWSMVNSSVDAGVPQAIKNLLSTALCGCGQVSFLDSASPLTFKPHPLKRLLGQPVFAITTTPQPEIAARLFCINDFPWDQRSQVVVLSGWQTEPVFEYSDLFDLWSDSSPDFSSLAQRMRAMGYLLPGPDGDFAEIVIFEDSLWNQFTQKLAIECQRTGLHWEEVSEQQFRETEWIIPSG